MDAIVAKSFGDGRLYLGLRDASWHSTAPTNRGKRGRYRDRGIKDSVRDGETESAANRTALDAPHFIGRGPMVAMNLFMGPYLERQAAAMGGGVVGSR